MRWTQQQLDTPVAELERFGLGVQTIDILENRRGIVYMRDLVKLDERDILNIPMIGEKRLDGLKRAMDAFVRNPLLPDKNE